ncbi:hypothetical protein A9Q89_04800 [Gammaproteobacteria bacterium 53_120_T64]|nr:hypothetical protein A9Q89_04800 [Gammaproteobacteria bacterium 53_120_T64]
MSQVAEYEEQARSAGDYWAILKRRCVHIIVPAVIVFLVGIVIAMTTPAMYRSEATILIEEQEIPRDLVRSTVTSFAAQQIQMITQRVMTVDHIEEIVTKFGLYEQNQAESRLPRTELAALFRKQVNLDLVSADIIDPRSGRATEATIAFTLSFDDRSPSTTQKVTNELVTLYLNTNLKARADRAAGASGFLAAQSESLNSELLILESRLAEFKALNKSALPELHQFNLSIVERTEREVSDVNLRLQVLKKQQIRLSAELAQLSPSAPIVLSTGETVLSDVDRLKAMQSEYRAKSALYKSSHPDIKRLKREISALQSVLGGNPNTDTLQQQVRQQRDVLQQLKDGYTIDHPQVQSAKLVLQDLEAQLAGQENIIQYTDTAVADNPAYVFLDTQLKSSAAESSSLRLRSAELKQKLSDYEGLLQRGPVVEQEYKGILREYNTAQAKYQELRLKQREAEVAQNLEQERKGERFTLIEPPNLPLSPESPNRLAIIMLAFILAGAAGMGSAVLFELMDKGIYGAQQLQKLSAVPLLVVVPYLDNSEDDQRRKRQRLGLLSGALVVGLASLFFIHFMIKPLDILWFLLINRMGLG